MNNRPPISPSSSDVLNSFRKRRQRQNPNLVYILAGIFVLGGLVLLVMWLLEPGKPLNALFATDTPTPTATYTPTNTPPPTDTPTITPTETITLTPTASGPFNYTVQQGDSLFSIAEKFNLGDDGIAKILIINPYSTPATQGGFPVGIDPSTQNIIPGQVITIPNPDFQLPTATPIPPNLPRGTKIEYTVQNGDTLAGIASKFNSTTDDIIKANNISDPNSLFVGQQLEIPVNLVTPTATRPPTSTPGPNDATATWTPVN